MDIHIKGRCNATPLKQKPLFYNIKTHKYKINSEYHFKSHKMDIHIKGRCNATPLHKNPDIICISKINGQKNRKHVVSGDC